jgi:hypothetical protein
MKNNGIPTFGWGLGTELLALDLETHWGNFLKESQPIGILNLFTQKANLCIEANF